MGHPKAHLSFSWGLPAKRAMPLPPPNLLLHPHSYPISCSLNVQQEASPTMSPSFN
jgi:hypothetical protein